MSKVTNDGLTGLEQDAIAVPIYGNSGRQRVFARHRKHSTSEVTCIKNVSRRYWMTYGIVIAELHGSGGQAVGVRYTSSRS